MSDFAHDYRLLSLVAELSNAAERERAARKLAQSVGAEQLIVFAPDPDLGDLLPSAGFPQTLPGGLLWQKRLQECVSSRSIETRLPCPYSGTEQPVLLCAGVDGSVLALLGGKPDIAAVAAVQSLLPLLTASFKGERVARTAAAHQRIAEESAARAGALAASLDRVRRNLGEALRRANATAAENARLYKEVKDADRRKDEFLAMLAHELRNPLAPVRNALQIMKIAAHDQTAIEQARQMAERQIVHLTRLVDDLMDVSRITRGKIKLNVRPVELATILAGAIEASRPLIELRRHELTVTYPPEPVRLNADATRLVQVVTNLLNNAAKYSEEGGNIWLTAEREGAEVLISVRDTGIGIPSEMLPKIFDLFTQVDRSLDRSEGGLGIGLTLVRRLVEMHGGTVQAFSKGPGHGSEFVVRLPTCAAVATPSGPHPSESQSAMQLRILVVDDNVDAAESLGLLLRIQGHEIQTAHDGADALRLASVFRPDVVLLDIGLPRLDGYEVARRLRKDDNTRRCLLVAMTGYGQEEDRRKSRAAGFDLHIVKPVHPDAVREILAVRAGLMH